MIKKRENIEIFINEQNTMNADSTLVLKFQRDKNLKDAEHVIVKSVPINAVRDGENKIAIRSKSPTPVMLKRVELAVQYGDVNKYGYF